MRTLIAQNATVEETIEAMVAFWDTLFSSRKKGVYITGLYYESVPTYQSNSHAGYWLGGEWNLLVTPPGTVSSSPSQIFIAGTDVYITGVCKREVIIQSGYWKNGEWHTFDTISQYGTSKTAEDIAVAANGDVYITGTRFERETDTSLKHYSGYWLNGIWHDLPVPSNFIRSSTEGIIIDDGNVYIGGRYSDSNPDNSYPCYWVNGMRHELPINGGIIRDSHVNKGIAVSGGKVYTLHGYSGYWINDIWHELPQKGEYNGIAVSGDDVYVIGFVDNCGYWHNEEWHELPKPVSSTCISPWSIAVFDRDVYITGRYSGTDGINHPCYWRNGILHLLAEPTDAAGSFAVAVAMANVKRTNKEEN